MGVPTLETRRGRPRNVTNRDWFVDHPDGRVSFVTLRRAESDGPSSLVLAFEGADDAEARSSYLDWLDEQHERVTRMAARRAKWGPLGTGKMV
jgi:hypothetical protein